MTVQKSASKTALLLQCPRPFSADTETEDSEPGEAAIYGTRWHKKAAQILDAHTPLTPDGFYETEGAVVDELGSHVIRALDALAAWMAPSGNPFGLAFKVVEVETSRAIDLTKSSDGTLIAILNEEDHTYLTGSGVSLDDNYLAGTADVVLEAESSSGIFRVVLDHKTGEDRRNEYPTPSQVPQMQSLAEMWEADAVAILHAPKDAPVQIYAEPIARGISRFRHELWRAYRLVDSGFMRPGPECKFCPARTSCPAKQGELIASTTALVKKVTGDAPITRLALNEGAFHMMLGELDKLQKQARGLLRESVRSGDVIERPDGKVLELQTVSIERLSKKSILEAYGKSKGEELLQTLRDDGALSSVEEERLVAK